MNEIEELKQLKELLDTGILTEEEFAAKKKQILNL
ncbi:SHOCT domain-containing protein [Lactobacillus sp. ESL0245]|nr:SHOCT domain-containing protein [Lactobacillus sp. ESL0247]RMC28816.1 SHOCT domain-containing protein [Lactobacillus sp. ESL0246]RMC31899.1 SHOCT domain-containing protein [Lactobacillus sp. ESL0245]